MVTDLTDVNRLPDHSHRADYYGMDKPARLIGDFMEVRSPETNQLRIHIENNLPLQ